VLLLINENVDHAVGMLLAATHDVRHVDQVLGPGVTDPVVEQYCRSQGAILVTGDASFARRLRQRDSQLACLWLHDLVTEERNRVAELLEVIEREAALSGPRFWMEIKSSSYTVER